MDSPLMGLVVLAVFALAAFLTGRGAVRVMHRTGRCWYAVVPLLVTVGSGCGVAWLLWPSYYIAPVVLLWWACAFFGNIAGWFCSARGRHA
ncbi:hypothetical protein [Streptomyces sp. NPDC008001]|uniref:hypothetical protein n=1 Tax=Streptomyces sp. NPDC008001 TaxID=3364804 RepID=UPI0036EE87F9